MYYSNSHKSKCSNLSCGCKTDYLTTPDPCPTPDACPDEQPCSEVFDSQCLIYNGASIICGPDTVVETGDTVQDALAQITAYFCNGSAPDVPTNITCGEDLVVLQGTSVVDALPLIVQYFCDAVANIGQSIVIGGDNINVNSVTVGSTTTYTVSQPSKIFFYEEFISDIDIVPGAPLPGPDNYFFPTGYEILTFQNTYLNPATFKVNVSYNTDIPSIVGFPTNALENWVDGAIVTTVGLVDTVQYETLGVTDMEIYLWDTVSNNIISGVSPDTVRTTPGDHPVDVRFTNNKKPKNTAFFKVVTLQPGEFVSLKFKSKAGSTGRLLKAQILVEEL